MSKLTDKLGITPGPWWAETTYIAAMVKGKRPNGEVIGNMHPSINGLFEQSQNEANTKCAAAAPEMLEVLIDLLTDALNTRQQTHGDFRGGPEKYYSEDIKIIEKATGKTWQEIKQLIGG